MRPFSNITLKIANKLHLLVNSLHCAAGIFFIEKLVDFRKNCCNFVLGHGS